MNGLKILWSKKAVSDIRTWSLNNKKVVKRISSLIEDIQRNHFIGLGKPEPLKHDLSGFWSRRIDKNHRLVYKVENSVIYILSCKDHY
jgi:toxin YoeB